MANIRIASWNVNSIRARFDVLSKWLKKKQYEIIFVQETKVQDHEFPIEDIKNIGYEVIFLGQKSYNGVAILSKEKINTLNKNLPGDKSDDQARFITSKIKDIELICIYLPNGNPIDTDKFTYKLSWMDRLIRHAKKLVENEEITVLAGDYNVIPEEIDVYDYKKYENDALFKLEMRKKYRELVNLGFHDIYRYFNKGKQEYTFWDYMAGAWQKNHGMRIDHFLVTNSILNDIKSINIDKKPRSKVKPSDHTPIELIIN